MEGDYLHDFGEGVKSSTYFGLKAFWAFVVFFILIIASSYLINMVLGDSAFLAFGSFLKPSESLTEPRVYGGGYGDNYRY